MQGVKFDIEVECDGVTEVIFSRMLQPKRNIGDRGWHNFIFSLEKYSGKTVYLVFSTSGSGEDLSYGWSAWGWGKVVKPLEDIRFSKGYTIEEIGINKCLETEMPELMNSKVRIGNKKVIITKVEVQDIDGKERMTFQSGEIVIIKTHIHFNQAIEKDLTVGCVIKNKYTEIFGTNARWEGLNLGTRKKGESITVSFSQKINLATGLYSVTTGCAVVHSDEDVEILDRCYDCVFFRISSDKKMVGVVDFETKVDFYVNENT